MGLINVRFRDDAKSLAVEGGPGEELFYDYVGLLKLLDACERHGVVILGIEGFNKIDCRIEPNEDALADFSSLSHQVRDQLVRMSVAESRRFLASVDSPEELLWSIVTDSDG